MGKLERLSLVKSNRNDLEREIAKSEVYAAALRSLSNRADIQNISFDLGFDLNFDLGFDARSKDQVSASDFGS